MTMSEKELTEQLEKLVDATSIDTVARCLALVCFEKAEHVQINWQDRPLARQWESNGKRIATVSEKLK